ncbi:class F sortase [Kitasatospora sp. NPDC096204]|uniref:class F sortase n=1 Tax=Kitasatospora sp. NPDC096204 TaxID=3364094 RepID=UPI00380DDD14
MKAGRFIAVGVAIGVAALGLDTLLQQTITAPTGPPPKPAAAAAKPATAAAFPVEEQPASAPHPTRIAIPEISVDAPFTEVSLTPSGELDVPPADDPNLAGWYKDGPVPGDRGAAIVLGHVDTKKTTAVFWGLGALKPGNTVSVTRDDHMVAQFSVDSVEVFTKKDFPDELVYGQTADARLRLITCGGSYDREHNDYTGNVVVFAHLLSLQHE